MSRINNPIISNFKTNEILTDNIQINNSIITSNNNIINLPFGATGICLLTSQFVSGVTGNTGPNGATGARGLQGITGITSFTSPINTKVIIAYLTYAGTITYQNGTAITGINWPSSGVLNINISNGYFSAKPQNVQCIAGASSMPPFNVSQYYDIGNSSATQLILYFDAQGNLANLDVSIFIIGPA